MAGHFPFSGNTDRISVFGFYERYGLNQSMQEKYYKWWFDWAKKMVTSDADLNQFKGCEFSHFPYGQHSHQDFHLRQGAWATRLIDLGEFIKGTLFGRLTEEQMHHLDEEHHDFLHQLKAEAKNTPREPQPELGWFRHF